MTTVELLQNLGTLVTCVCAVLALGWWSFYVFTTRWWTNSGGRLLALTGLWQSVGMVFLVIGGVHGSTPMIDLAAGSPWKMFGRLLFILLVLTSLSYQWVLFLRVRREEEELV